MSAFRIPSATVQRGQRLAERRRANLIELELTGRWRLHFKQEDDFKAQLKAADENVEVWAKINAEEKTEAAE
jgi:hypothetical protein